MSHKELRWEPSDLLPGAEVALGVLYCTVLYCTVLYCTVLYCTVLYCTVLYCTVLYCTGLDQSVGYNVIYHKLLFQKMEIIGFSQKSLSLFKDYLENRRQIVTVDGQMSDEVYIGPVSCSLYLLYIMDLPLLFQDITTSIETIENTETGGQNMKVKRVELKTTPPQVVTNRTKKTKK